MLTPLAFEYASEHKIDISNILGSGEKGKINIYDIKITQEPRTFKFARKRSQHDHHQGAIRVFPNNAHLANHSTPLKPLQQKGEKEAVQTDFPKLRSVTQGSAKLDSSLAQNLPADMDYSNSKAAIPHFSIKRTLPINPLLKHIDELNQFSSTAKVDLSSVLVKIMNLTLQKFPEFRTLIVGKSFMQAKYLLIQYKNLVDGSKDIVYEAWPNKPHQRSRLAKEALSKYPSIVILDGSETDLASIEPVLGFNSVSLKELHYHFWPILRSAHSYRKRLRL